MKNLKRTTKEFQEKKSVIQKHKIDSKVNSFGFKRQKENLIKQIVNHPWPNWGGFVLKIS